MLAGAQQLGVGAHGGHAAGLKQRDAVGEHDGRGAVRDHERGRVGHDLPQRVLDERLGVDVERRQRVVEHEHGGPGRDGARQRETLALAAGERESLFTDDRVDPVGQVVDEPGLRHGERLAQHRLGLGAAEHEVLPAEQHVLADGLREQRRVLEGHADVRAQLPERQITHVDAVDRDPPAGDVVQPPRQRRQRGLARPGQSHQGHRLAGDEVEVDAVQQVALAVRGILITEVDVFETQRTAGRGDRGGLRGVGDGVLLVEHLEDAVGGRPRVEEE